MSLVRALAARVPPIGRLVADRDTLRQRLAAMQASAGSPFVHYNAAFDPLEAIHRHALPTPEPHPDYQTNFLGVRIDPKFVPHILAGRAGTVDHLPIPANWHADIAEFGAALRAVDLAKHRFTVIELGCGWGCWITITGVAARRAGLDIHLIGVEGDPGHILFAREATAANGFDPGQVELHHGIAAATAGTALFPRQAEAGASWGLEPIFGATDAQRAEAQRANSHDVLPMLPLDQLAEAHARIDLLHVDIQGGEASLIAGSLPILNDKIAYLLIGTHSRAIEGALFDTLLAAGWRLEIERPAIMTLSPAGPTVTVDGVQGWRNMRLLPD